MDEIGRERQRKREKTIVLSRNFCVFFFGDFTSATSLHCHQPVVLQPWRCVRVCARLCFLFFHRTPRPFFAVFWIHNSTKNSIVFNTDYVTACCVCVCVCCILSEVNKQHSEWKNEKWKKVKPNLIFSLFLCGLFSYDSICSVYSQHTSNMWFSFLLAALLCVATWPAPTCQ